jgi:hypothetical protein
MSVVWFIADLWLLSFCIVLEMAMRAPLIECDD